MSLVRNADRDSFSWIEGQFCEGRPRVKKPKWASTASEHVRLSQACRLGDWITRGQPTPFFLQLLSDLSPEMSYLSYSTSLLQSTEIIGQVVIQ